MDRTTEKSLVNCLGTGNEKEARWTGSFEDEARLLARETIAYEGIESYADSSVDSTTETAVASLF